MTEDEQAVRNLLADAAGYFTWIDERRSEFAHELALMCADDDEDAYENLCARREADIELLTAELGMHITSVDNWRAYVSDYYEQMDAEAA